MRGLCAHAHMYTCMCIRVYVYCAHECAHVCLPVHGGVCVYTHMHTPSLHLRVGLACGQASARDTRAEFCGRPG